MLLVFLETTERLVMRVNITEQGEQILNITGVLQEI